MKTFRIPLRVVFYKGEGRWIAHCLEFDLCGDGETKSDALAALSEAIAIQVEESVSHNNGVSKSTDSTECLCAIPDRF